MACCCVLEIVEINSPTPSTDKRYIAVLAVRSTTDPFIGIANQNTPTSVTRAISKKLMAAKGRVFPRTSSTGLSGVTISCYMVPISRSRTTAMAVRSRQVSMIMMAITPGTL